MTRDYVICDVQRPPRWSTFLLGLAMNLVGVLALTVWAPTFTTVEEQNPIATSEHVTLVAPALEHPISVPRSQLAKHELPKHIPPRAARMTLPEPVVTPPKTEKPPVVTEKPVLPNPERRNYDSVATRIVPKAPVKHVQTNIFESEKTELTQVRRPARAVQTGGFGDPEGVPGQGNSKRNTVTVASLGAFDLPSGPGRGNGTGKAHGVAGVVRSAGFADGTSSNFPVRASRTVAASGFAQEVAPPVSTFRAPVEKKAQLEPVEILYKPRPAYTDEARRKRVEGEVLLDVVFEASGSLHVRRVVKGLGYGLDDNALAAAQRIQFRPARRDGQPYDCAALVHIVFELSE